MSRSKDRKEPWDFFLYREMILLTDLQYIKEKLY